MKFKKVFYIRNGSFKGLYRKDGVVIINHHQKNLYKIWKKLNDEEYGYYDIIIENCYNELYKIPKIFNLKHDLKRIMNVIDKTSPNSTQKYLLYLADNEYPLCMAGYEKVHAKKLWIGGLKWN